jgi:hypothetical protein
LVQSPPLEQGTFFGDGAHPATRAATPSHSFQALIALIASFFR